MRKSILAIVAVLVIGSMANAQCPAIVSGGFNSGFSSFSAVVAPQPLAFAAPVIVSQPVFSVGAPAILGSNLIVANHGFGGVFVGNGFGNSVFVGNRGFVGGFGGGAVIVQNRGLFGNRTVIANGGGRGAVVVQNRGLFGRSRVVVK